MHVITSSWKDLLGQNDVHSALHVPMVYESVPTSPQHWEYRVLDVDARELPTEALLNELGEQGWLLASILEQPLAENRTRVQYYFVRQKAAE